MKTITRKFQKGFSLGEVLLSLAVLTAGILPILAALTSALNTSIESRDAIIGAGLAQEGVELVTNVKDYGMKFKGNAFIGFSPGNRTCRIDMNAPSLADPGADQIECGNGLDFNLSLLSPYQMYAHDDMEGKFKRKVFIGYTPGQDSASVKSAVYWGAYDPNHSDVDANCTALNECALAQTVLRAWK